MDKTIVGLVGAASALALTGAASAATPPADLGPPKPAQSYADLLDPIPGAAARLRAAEASRLRGPEDELQVAQVVIPVPMPGYGYHHHHHHHYQQREGWYRWHYHPRYHHHHHHHHHYYDQGY